MTSVHARLAPIGSSRRERGFGLLTFVTMLVLVPIALAVAAALTLGLAAILASDRLPSLDVLTDFRPKVPLRIWTADGVLIGEFGEELPSRRFARIGRSLVINLEALRSVGRIQGNGATLQFADSSETLVIGRAAMARLRQLLAAQPFSEELPG
jgi:hypothetical protein